MKLFRNATFAAVAAAALGALAIFALAQEFPAYQGGPQRLGRHTGDPSQETPGRAFLRWWDPVISINRTLDNWDVTQGGGKAYTSWQPDRAWQVPAGTEAFSAVESQLGEAPYRYSSAVASQSTEQFWVPASGTANTFDWTFPGVRAGEEYALYVNLPVGPTGIDERDQSALVYPQQYFVYQVEGIQNPDNPGEPYREIIDTYASGGGFARIGNGGLSTDRVFVATGTEIKITLINTIPRDGQGNLTDTRTNICVYADAASIVRAMGALGSYAASPIVGRLSGNTNPYPWRVVASRNEPSTFQVGSEIRSYSMGMVSNYWHSGLKVDPNEPGKGGDVRRNILWSWPAVRPFDDTTAEYSRFTAEKRDFLLGQGRYPGPSRADEFVQMDNLANRVTVGAGWTSETSQSGYKGNDYLRSDAVGTPGARVHFRPVLKEGDYTIQVWRPGGGSNLAIDQQFEIYTGNLLVGTASVDMSGAQGWVTLRINQTSSFTSFASSLLSVAVTNAAPNSPGRSAYADMVRFVKQADLHITSTPVFTTTDINVGGSVEQRDVVVVALQNGKLYCMDAAGDPVTGRTSVYWTWPSELPTGTPDPNQVDTIDGKDGIAEMPLSFDTSSAFVARVQTGPTASDVEDLLYVGASNGKVYCLEMDGRGDQARSHAGTTVRRWSFPDDFPSANGAIDLGPVVGSVSYSPADGGTVFVPSVNGRLFALDAKGDPATRTTSIKWQFPATTTRVGAISMAPVVEFDKVYFGTGDGAPTAANANRKFYSLNVLDGNADAIGDVVWESDGGTIPFTAFGTPGPTTVPSTLVGGGMPNTVYVSNPNGTVYAFDADLGGAPLWTTSETGTTASGSLSFTYLNTFKTDGTLDFNPLAPPVGAKGRPVVGVPGADGRYTFYFARTTDVNADYVIGDPISTAPRAAWEYGLEGQRAVSLAYGALQTNIAPPDDDKFYWMYGADDLGYLYAFNHNPSYPDGDQTITPGPPPGTERLTPNDPTAGNLRQIVRNAKVRFLLPTDYDNLLKKLRANTLKYADVTAAAGTGANAKVTRRHWEYGETVYMVVYDLPDPTFFNPAMTYTIEYQFNSPGSTSQRRLVEPSSLVDGDLDKRRVALAAFPMLGSGNNALAPGNANVQVRAQTTRTAGNPNAGQSANLSIPNANYRPGHTFNLVNPMALSVVQTPTRAQSLGFTIDPTDSEVQWNGNQVGTAITDQKWLAQPFGPDLNSLSDPVSHGQQASSRMFVWDRSCMRLLLGEQRGLQNVRFQTSALRWQLNARAAKDGIYRPLDDTIFANFEELPGAQDMNASLDYPDLRRESMTVTKQVFGDVENPLFTAVGLEPPSYSSDDLTNYRATAAIYNASLPRQLRTTEFLMGIDIPKYQPPARYGYLGSQYVYVDANQPGRQFSGASAQESFRGFNSTAAVAIDERISVGTPTVDLGGVPSGAGFTPIAPWNDPTFSLGNPLLHSNTNPYFQRFSAFNEGNVNLRNVRVAKSVTGQPGRSMMQSSSNSPLAWLDSSVNLHTDLDPGFVPPQIAGRVMVQKARPGDVAPNRLRVNPIRRDNPNTGTTGGPLLDPTLFPLEDPRIAVSTPIGTPVGQYAEELFVFEDRDALNLRTDVPVLGPDQDLESNPTRDPNVYEPYSEPGMVLRFTVRETRLTNRNSAKTAPMVDNLGLSGNEPFQWSNLSPTALRDGNGNLVVAFASNRLEGRGLQTPGWDARLRNESDERLNDQWRLYVANLSGTTPPNGVGGSPLRDLNAFTPASNNTWFGKSAALGGLPGNPKVLFGLKAGEQIADNALRFGSPTFPSAGVFDPMDPTSDTGRPAGNQAYLAFLGEADKQTAGGDTVRESRLFISSVQLGNGGATSVSAPVPLAVGSGNAVDPRARLGRPSVVQSGQVATVFFTTSATGQSQINWATFAGNQWTVQGNGAATQSIQLSNAFESVASPSATLRRVSNQRGEIGLAFTGKLRGRPTAEVFFGRISTDGAGRPTRTQRAFTVPWATRFDQLVNDPATGVYWSQGAEWRSDSGDVSGGNSNVVANPLADSWIDLMTPVTNGYQSILVHSTKQYEASTKVLTADTTLGGKAIINLGNGSVRFQGAIVPRNLQVAVRYTPRFVKVSAGSGANYRGVSVVFDDRLTDDFLYWNGSANPLPANSIVANDRYVFTYTRTSADGSLAARPYMRSFRYGVQLPSAVQTRTDNGAITLINVSGAPFQVDPVAGKVYFGANAAGSNVTIRYNAVDETGRFLGVFTVNTQVGLIAESQEQYVAMDQVANESAPFVALDAQNTPFALAATNRRPRLFWMFWQSTRGGVPDVYFQTIAPKWGTQPNQ